jgi:hypothetical protein
MHAQDRHVGADQGLAHEGRQYRGVVAYMTFALRSVVTSNDGHDTLQYVILLPGVLSEESDGVSRHGRDPDVSGQRRNGAA